LRITATRLSTALFIFALCGLNSYSQDIHFSHVNRQPIYQNPANSGLFDGDFRFTANYKDQWRQVSVPFSTVALAMDSKWKKKGLNYSLLLFHDQVGDGKFQTLELMGALGKTIQLDVDSIHTVSAALQFGLNYRTLDPSKFYFDNQFNGVSFDPNLPTNEVLNNNSKSNINVSAGVVYQWNKSKDEKFTGGISLHNINRPDQSFYGEPLKRDARLSLFGIYDYRLNYDLAIIPGLSFNIQGKYRELLPGAQVRYYLVDRLGEYRAIDGGIWFRSRDAVIVRAGIAINNWSFAMSYDTNISKLIPASNARGGLELSAHYILRRFKPASIKHRICPDYI
jgi:type IX secretion system PorP/SprF family membrane protein